MFHQIKVWGETREIAHTQFYSRHELILRPNTYCSLHYHQHRANKFTIISGVVTIIEMYGPMVRKFVLDANSDNLFYDVPSLVPHMFVVNESGYMVEEYYPDRGGEVDRDDIVRIVEGGMMNSDDLDKLPWNIISNIKGS